MPLQLKLGGKVDSEDSLSHVMTLCLLYKEKTFLKAVNEIQLFTPSFILSMTLAIISLLIILAVALVISHKVANKIFKPLSLLNMSMRDIINDGMKRDLESEEIATQSCKEISDLYKVF